MTFDRDFQTVQKVADEYFQGALSEKYNYQRIVYIADNCAHEFKCTSSLCGLAQDDNISKSVFWKAAAHG